MSEVSPLGSRLQRSAESVGVRGGHVVPLRYGSAAGELAVCMRSVGLVDREDLRVLTVVAKPESIDQLIADVLDGGLLVGEAATVGHAHWGRLAPDRVLVVLPAISAALFCEQLLRQRHADETSVEETALQGIGLIGPATAGLLSDLGVHGALAGANGHGRIASPSTSGATAWLLFDDASALALVEPEEALAFWNAVSLAGRRFGLGYVGAEAAERYETIRCKSGDRAGH